MAHQGATTHRRILASPEPPNPSSMDPLLKRRSKPTDNSDPTALSKHFYMSSKLSSSRKVSPPSLTGQKPTKNRPLASIDAHSQAKGMTLSADFDACRVSLIKAKHHQKLKTFEAKVEKDNKTNEVYSVKAKKPLSQESVEVKKVDQVLASQNNRKSAWGKVKSSKELKDLVDSVEKKKLKEVRGSEKKKKEAYAKEKERKELKDMTEGPLDIKRITVSLGGGRRRSFGGSQVELADFLAKNGARVVSVDMPPFMQIHAVDCARKTCDSLENFTAKTLALTLKKEFDGVYGPAWHCIVGTSFGSFVTHSVGGFLYFSVDQKLYVLLFKTTVQRAN